MVSDSLRLSIIVTMNREIGLSQEPNMLKWQAVNGMVFLSLSMKWNREAKMIDLGQDEEYAVIKHELQGKDMSGIQPFYVDSILYGFYVWGEGGCLLQQ